MIIPISHEDLRGRRWPYVTVAIIALNVLIFAFTNTSIQRGHHEYVQKAEEAFEYYVSHPYLQPKPPLDKMLARLEKASRKERLTVEAMKALHESAAEAQGGVDEATKAEKQAELDALCTAAMEAEKNSPLKTYAYVPAENNGVGLITSQFLHGGWMHLIFNMLFLWLAGCNIEDRWGRVVFPLFYLSAGAVAALAHKAAAPESIVPLIGASGAIAGAMGAFLIKFAKTKIKFLMIFFLRATTFSAPAYLMLPLWLGTQIFYGLMFQGDEGGVAFWAHVGGFAYGAAFAVGMKMTGLEEKVDKAIEGQISVQQAPEIVQAGELIDAGKSGEAIDLLEKFAMKQPSNIDAQLELLRASKAAQDGAREKRAYIRLIGLYMQQNAPDTAFQLYEEMQQLALDGEVPVPLRLRLARYLEKNNLLERAAEEFCNIYSSSQADATSFQALLAHANLMLRMGRKQEALQLFTIAQNSPVPHLDWDATIAHGLKQVQALPDGPGSPAASEGVASPGAPQN